ncbi:S26 family signal peptidase [Sporosarcina sp.]
MVVPEDEYFVMGDNIDNSQDSSMIGTIYQKGIFG